MTILRRDPSRPDCRRGDGVAAPKTGAAADKLRTA